MHIAIPGLEIFETLSKFFARVGTTPLTDPFFVRLERVFHASAVAGAN